MTNPHEIATDRRSIPWRPLGWGGVAVLLSIPLLARLPWTVSDFVIAGMMFGIAGLAIELAARASLSWRYRGGAIVAVAASFLLVWVNGAVGFLGDEDNPANLWFFAVIAVALAGAIGVRFRSAGMAWAMLGAAFVQLAIGAVAIPLGWASPGAQGLYEVVLGSTTFLGLWLLSAALFRWDAIRRATPA